MFLLGCLRFVVRENAKKKFRKFGLFAFTPPYVGFHYLICLFVLHCHFSLKFTHPNSPFCVFSFFHLSLLSLLVILRCRYCFFFFPVQKKKKSVMVCLMNGVYQCERQGLTSIVIVVLN